MATPTATAPVAFGSKVTVQAPDIQNAPPSFIELASGKMLFFFTPSSSHASPDSTLAMKSAANEAAANAGTFSATTVLVPFVYPVGGGNGYPMQIQTGPHKGRVLVVYGSGNGYASPKEWEIWIIYSDDDGVTWSAPYQIPSVYGGAAGIENIKGMSALCAPVEIPGTNGQELVLPVLGFTTGYYEWSKLLASTDGGLTWAERSVIHGPTTGRAPSEPCACLVYKPDGTIRLAVTVNYWNASGTTSIYIKFSDDWGYTWSHVGEGITIASNATAPPAIIQAYDGSLIVMYRNLSVSENTYIIRSQDFGLTWGQATLVDNNGRERYGNLGNLQSGRLGMCYGTETYVFPSTQAGIYWQTFTVTPPSDGGPPSIVSSSVNTAVNPPVFSSSIYTNAIETLYRVEWGPTTSYGNDSGWFRLGPRMSIIFQGISQQIAGLSPGNYHARIVAMNVKGVTNGPDIAFTAGTEAVGRSAATPYAITSSVARSLSQGYSVIATVGSSCGLPYTLQAFTATLSLSQPYSVTGTVGKSLQAPYTIGRTVGDSLEFRYNIPATTVAYQTDRRMGPPEVVYSTLRRVAVGASFPRGRSLGIPYQISPPVSVTLAQPYLIKAITSRSLQQLWSVTFPTGNSLEFSYKILIGNSLGQKYDIHVFVGRSLNPPYLVALKYIPEYVAWNDDRILVQGHTSENLNLLIVSEQKTRKL